MILTNYHTHNSLCDGKGDIPDYIESALEKGFAAIGFSSHAPVPVENDWTLKSEDLGTYCERVREAREHYSGKIEVYLGLEADFIPGVMHPRDKWIRDLGLDYVIGSVHFLPTGMKDPEYLTVDGSEEEFLLLLNNAFDGRFPKLAGAYFDNVREMTRIGGFDILGHLDLLRKRNLALSYLDESEPWYRNEIDRTLAVLSGTGIIMEINTGGIARAATETPYPSGWIITAAVKEGIPVQINSDAHTPENVGFFFDEAREMAAMCGVRALKQLVHGTWQDFSLVSPHPHNVQ